MKLAFIVPTWDRERGEEKIEHYIRTSGSSAPVRALVYAREGVLENMAGGAREAMQHDPDVLAFMHDDVTIYEEGWGERIERFWSVLRNLGVLSFGGATGLGTDELYKRPYQLQQLARLNFYSNMRDWKVHGHHLTCSMPVVVVDGFCMIITAEAYREMGGWEAAIGDGMPPHHMYDAWAACRMEELNRRSWAIPIECQHHGGLTSTSGDYQEWVKGEGYRDDTEVHEKAHEVIYKRFRNVLPLRC